MRGKGACVLKVISRLLGILPAAAPLTIRVDYDSRSPAAEEAARKVVDAVGGYLTCDRGHGGLRSRVFYYAGDQEERALAILERIRLLLGHSPDDWELRRTAGARTDTATDCQIVVHIERP